MKEILDNWKQFINEQEAGSGVRANIRTSVEKVRKQLVKRYQSPQAAESFVNFSRGMGSPKFLQAEDEEIKAYFNKTLAPKLINVVTSIGIIDDNSKYPSDVAAKFAIILKWVDCTIQKQMRYILTPLLLLAQDKLI